MRSLPFALFGTYTGNTPPSAQEAGVLYGLWVNRFWHDNDLYQRSQPRKHYQRHVGPLPFENGAAYHRSPRRCTTVSVRISSSVCQAAL